MGENPVDVTQAMNPFKVSLLNDNNEPAQQIQRGDPYFFNVETSGKFPGKSPIQTILKFKFSMASFLIGRDRLR